MRIFLVLLIIVALVFSGCGAPPQEDISYISIEDLIAEQKNATNETPVISEEPALVPEASPIETQEKPAEEVTEEQPLTMTVTEGDAVRFPKLRATDPDGDPILYTFSSPLNERGEWITEVGDAGEYDVTITASDGKSDVSRKVQIIVLSRNKLPTISGVPDVVDVKEGERLELSPDVADPDGDKVEVQYRGFMSSSARNINFDEAGEHTVTIVASDGKGETTKDVKIDVENVNRPPRLEPINNVVLSEGETVILGVKANDPDGDAVQISFDAPLDVNGTWVTQEGDAGNYNVKVTASDGMLTDTKFAKILIQAVNKKPVLEPLDDVTVKEGETVQLEPVASDPDGDKIEITYAGWMDGPVKETGYNDAGSYVVTVTVSDGKAKVSEDVTVHVENVNRPPVFVDII